MHHKLKATAILAAAFLSAVALALPSSARADEAAEKGRAIFNQHQHAVVTVQVVQKWAAYGRYQALEAKTDVTGTVVDPSGLTVLALSSVDPTELSKRVTGEVTREMEVGDIKILLEDGTEVPAQIVLRDKDLDLVFIRPKTKPASPMDAIDLTKSSHAQVLDQLITLNRLKRPVGRAYAASVERISAVVQKPRTFYVPDSSQTETSAGSPAFALDGSVVGMIVMRGISSDGSSRLSDTVAAIILPAEDIAKGAAQAPTEVKPEPEKKDASKDASAPAAAPTEPAK